MVKAVINNLKAGILNHYDGFVEAVSYSMSPDKKYAVIEVYRDLLYIAVNVVSFEDGVLVGDYVNYTWTSAPDELMLYHFVIDWDFIRNGYCKLILFAPEMVNEFGGSFQKTIKRFYFDWELYKRCYEKRYGIPCTKQDPNSEE